MTSSSNNFLAGCAGGFAQVLVGQPFDIVKVRLQAATASQKLYNNSLDVLKKIVRYEGGPSALWRGTLPPLLGVGASVSLQFGVNEKTKQLMKNMMGVSKLSISQMFACGMFAGLCNSMISIPIEHTRIKMQLQGGISKPSLFSSLKNIMGNYGVRGLYKGGVPTLWRESISFGIYFSMYEWVLRKFRERHLNNDALSMPEIALAGGLSGLTLWCVTFPIDVVKTKIQADSLSNPIYKSSLDCMRKIYQSEGLKGFYRGLNPCLMRSVPVNGATFMAYEAASKVLKGELGLKKKFQMSI